jgi:hypothetical protein
MSTANANKETDRFVYAPWSDKSNSQAGKDRFLYHKPFGLAGINHQLSNLWALLAEAVYLDRTAIIPPLLLAGHHNNGVPLNTKWERYIDINSFEQVVKVRPSDFIESVRFDTIRNVNNNHLPRTLLHEQAQLIVRKFSEPNAYELLDLIKNSTALAERFESLRKPSSIVMKLAEKIRSQLGDYDCIHVRRTDRLNEFKNLGLDRQTRPEYILKRISKWIEEGRNLYVMSDERDPRFFSPLAQFYEVRTIFDFPELLALRRSGDNYLAFEVEKVLFKSARVRVGTFKESAASYCLRSKFSLVDYSMQGKMTFCRRIMSWVESALKRFLAKRQEAG